METVNQFSNKLWKKWADQIGLKPIFIMKAALEFLEKKNLVAEFEIYVKELLGNKNDISN